MNAVNQARRRRNRPSSGRGRLLVAAALLGLAGCETGSLQQGDPFVGIHANPAPLASGGPGATPINTAAGGPPPLPPSNTSPSQAALAGGTNAAPEDPSHLRMSGPEAVPTGLSGGAAARGASPSGVSIGSPEPAGGGSTSNLRPVAIIPVAGSIPTPAAVPSAPPVVGSSGNITTFEQAQQALDQRGVTWQSWIKEDGQWRLECSVPNPATPSINRRFVTEKPFPDPLSAIRAILVQIDAKKN